MAQANPTLGYDRIVGALANLGHVLSDRTVGNILRRQGISPAPQRKQTTRWRDFIRAHMDVLVGTDFFTIEVLTLTGLVTYYVLFVIQLETRRVCLAGITPYPDHQWMEQEARNVTMKDWGFLAHSRYLLHDRDGKFCPGFREVIKAGQGKAIEVTSAQSESECIRRALCAFGERRMLVATDLFGENSLRRALSQYCEHYHWERNHQGKNNRLLFPSPRGPDRCQPQGAIRCREGLGGLLKYYEHRAS